MSLPAKLVNNCGAALLHNLDKVACRCGSKCHRIPSVVSIVIAGNAGPKLRTRVALSDELEKQGIVAPLFSSDLGKDKARWLLKKEGIR